MGGFAGLVLAGSRGEGDPLAQAEGVRHRALLPVAGVPMLLRVVRTLRRCPDISSLVVSIDEPDALDEVEELRELRREGQIDVRRSMASPSRSVLDAIDARTTGTPFLVTTADHALLRPDIVESFLATEATSEADVLVGLVARSLLEAAFPESTRTYLPLRTEQWSGANLFAFRSSQARRAVEFWTRAESFRKRPWRLVSVFGPMTLALFALGRLDIEAALARASRVIGARIEPVALPYAEAAIDVDRPSDLELVNRLLSEA